MYFTHSPAKKAVQRCICVMCDFGLTRPTILEPPQRALLRQHFFHLASQLAEREGFRQEVEVGGIHNIAAGDFFRITRDNDDADFRAFPPG